MSRQIAPQTRSKALRRTKRVLDARQGMEGAKNAYRGSQEVKRADTPNQGLSGRQEPRQPPAKPICTEQAAMRLVGGRRPSVLQRWGSGVLPRRFPVALKALPEPWRLGFFWRTGSKNTQRIMPYLTQLKGQFTRVVIKNISNLSRSYSIRIYEILQQFRSTGERIIALDDFKSSLMLDGKYKDFKTLNRDLIKPCVDELNKKSDLAVTVETIKKGRTVVALHFRFKEDKQIKMTI